jgi:hypothetical protein
VPELLSVPDLNDPAEAVAWLRGPRAIRARCAAILEAARADGLAHFALRAERLEAAADYVARTIRANYPTLDIPTHSRWRHFAVGGRDRWAELAARLGGMGAEEAARVRFDLVVTSVLLDAGAGAAWRYREPESGEAYARSEGLAVASFELFVGGALSSDPAHPLRADAAGLEAMTEARLAEAFQAGPDNPLVGLAGRAALLRRLGQALTAAPALFGAAHPRLGNLFDYLRSRAPDGAHDGAVTATTILAAVLDGLGPIWPGRIELGGVNLGDVWRHPAVRTRDLTDGMVPFHKLSQWLAYSLIEPLEDAGIAVMGVDELTGLPEYRNGGLFVDTGVLEPKHDAVLTETHEAGSEVVVEWRALTVALLDALAPLVRARLGKTEAELPLAKLLEGGTWSAGRRIARDRRPGGGPPITVASDGTVF